MDCEFPGRISVVEIDFIIKKVNNLGKRGMFGYSFHHTVSHEFSYFS